LSNDRSGGIEDRNLMPIGDPIGVGFVSDRSTGKKSQPVLRYEKPHFGGLEVRNFVPNLHVKAFPAYIAATLGGSDEAPSIEFVIWVDLNGTHVEPPLDTVVLCLFKCMHQVKRV
jgi:hypothetical protein